MVRGNRTPFFNQAVRPKTASMESQPYISNLKLWMFWIPCGHNGSVTNHRGHNGAIDNTACKMERNGTVVPLCPQTDNMKRWETTTDTMKRRISRVAPGDPLYPCADITERRTQRDVTNSHKVEFHLKLLRHDLI